MKPHDNNVQAQLESFHPAILCLIVKALKQLCEVDGVKAFLSLKVEPDE